MSRLSPGPSSGRPAIRPVPVMKVYAWSRSMRDRQPARLLGRCRPVRRRRRPPGRRRPARRPSARPGPCRRRAGPRRWRCSEIGCLVCGIPAPHGDRGDLIGDPQRRRELEQVGKRGYRSLVVRPLHLGGQPGTVGELIDALRHSRPRRRAAARSADVSCFVFGSVRT